MGLSAVGALIAIALAFLAQSPRLLTRLNMAGQRLDMRARTLTGYGLALLLLAMGFFAAGVPLGEADAVVAEAPTDELTTPATSDAAVTITATLAAGGQSGAMVGLPTSEPSDDAPGLPTVDLSAVAVVTGTVEVALTPGATTAEATPVGADASTPTAEATATLFPTATPTLTPSPTPTPTPIAGPTARVGDETSTLPVRRQPGLDEPVLAVLVRGEIILPLSGHAFHTGDVWREISTVAGIIGWVPERFLVFEEVEP
jgi:hypothetical protein